MNIQLGNSDALAASQLHHMIQLFGGRRPAMLAVLVDSSGNHLSEPVHCTGELSLRPGNTMGFAFGKVQIEASCFGFLSAVRFFKPGQPSIYVEHAISSTVSAGSRVISETL